MPALQPRQPEVVGQGIGQGLALDDDGVYLWTNDNMNPGPTNLRCLGAVDLRAGAY